MKILLVGNYHSVAKKTREMAQKAFKLPFLQEGYQPV